MCSYVCPERIPHMHLYALAQGVCEYGHDIHVQRGERYVLQIPDLSLLMTSVWNRPNTVSEKTVSNTELSEFFGPHRVPGRELSEFLSSYCFCAKANLQNIFAELTEFAAELSEFSIPKQYSRNRIPHVSFCAVFTEKMAPRRSPKIEKQELPSDARLLLTKNYSEAVQLFHCCQNYKFDA